MGRGDATEPVPVEAIQQAFRAGDNSGEIIRASTGEAATFTLKGQLLVRVYHQGRVRRIGASRVAWALSRNEWPRGRVALLGGERDFRPENLRLVRGGQNPASVGKSSLVRRQAIDAALLNALANHPGLSVVSLGELVGLSESGACIRLGKLAVRGLTQSPQCAPGRSWLLTAAGRELAMSASPVLDALDRQLLMALVFAPMRQLALARRVEVCPMTVKRRANALAQRGLVDAGPRFAITAKGYELLGPDAPKPWLKFESISAAKAPDVAERTSPDGLTRSQAARLGGLARSRQMHQRPYALTG